MTETIFVSLLGEAVDVWRPVRADHVYGDVYRIIEQPYDPAVEAWRFAPGDVVRCESIHSDDGPIVAAVARE